MKRYRLEEIDCMGMTRVGMREAFDGEYVKYSAHKQAMTIAAKKHRREIMEHITTIVRLREMAANPEDGK